MMEQEYQFKESNFMHICKMLKQHSGIKLSDNKQQMVYGRLIKRLRTLKLDNFDQYCQLISNPAEPEFEIFINFLTTNLTYFFREEHHFDFLRQHIALLARKQSKIRIWSAGCSSGEEPYSMAMALRESRISPSIDAKILATDINTEIVDFAKAGIYETEKTRGLSKNRISHNFNTLNNGTIQIKPTLSEHIIFKQLNLLEGWPMKGKFDVIFCRNVMIYFDKKTQFSLVNHFKQLITDDGYLIIGHSESLQKIITGFECKGRNIYQKVGM